MIYTDQLSEVIISAHTLTHAQENGRRQKTLVCEKFDHLYSVLEEKKREMSQVVTAEQEEKADYIRSLTRKYKDHLEESCKTVEMGIQTMEESEMALFLQVRDQMVHKNCFSCQYFMNKSNGYLVYIYLVSFRTQSLSSRSEYMFLCINNCTDNGGNTVCSQ